MQTVKQISATIAALILLLGGLGQASAGSGDNPAPKARLKAIKIFGSQQFSEHDIKSWLSLRKASPFSESLMRERSVRVLERLQEAGYYFARIDSVLVQYSSDSSLVELSFFLDEGGQTRISELSVAGLDSAHLNLLAELHSRSGKIFSPAKLEEDVELILHYFEARGHPYCQVRIERLQIAGPGDGEGLEIELAVDPGPVVTVGEIVIAGNEQTRDGVILRELAVKPGELYDQRKIAQIRSKLLKLGFFKWVNPPRIELVDDRTARLIIELADGSHNRFDGVVGYNPATPTSDGFVTGLLDVSFGNLFGTGRRADAHWQRRTQKTQEFRFGYTEPRVAGLPLNAGFSFEQLIQDTSYVQRQIGLDMQLVFNDKLSLFSSISTRSIAPDSVGALRFNIPSSSSLNLAVGLSFDTTTDPLNPRGGVKYQTGFEWSRKQVDSVATAAGQPDASQAFSQKRLSIDFENYFSLFHWQVVAIGLHGREVTSDEAVIDITDQYRLGGTRTLRGYREQQFRGSRIAWSNFEYRYILGPKSRFFAFFDLGYFFREERVAGGKISLDGVNVGYGFGLRLDTRLGFFGIDYGLGDGDSFSDGKVHIGLTNEF
ncbi:MAG: outer membrane protein assembly factor [bacterium]